MAAAALTISCLIGVYYLGKHHEKQRTKERQIEEKQFLENEAEAQVKLVNELFGKLSAPGHPCNFSSFHTKYSLTLGHMGIVMYQDQSRREDKQQDHIVIISKYGELLNTPCGTR